MSLDLKKTVTTVTCDIYLSSSILFTIYLSKVLNSMKKRERPLADHSLSNIMYEKKISYFQDEVYEL